MEYISPTIRKAVKTDIGELVELLRELFSIESDFDFNEARQRRGLFMMLKNPETGCVSVAEMESRLVGMVIAQIVISTAEGGLSGLIEDLVVRPELRGQGIGGILLDHIQGWAKSKGATRVQLLADKSNETGLSFYRKYGWRFTRMICLKKPL